MKENEIEKRMAQELEERRSDSQYVLEFMKIPAYLFDQSPSYDPDEKLRLTNINDLMESDKGLVIDWDAVFVTYYTTLKVKSVFYEFPLPIEEPQDYTLEMVSSDIIKSIPHFYVLGIKITS